MASSPAWIAIIAYRVERKPCVECRTDRPQEGLCGFLTGERSGGSARGALTARRKQLATESNERELLSSLMRPFR
jgi:hypothetical protein